MWDWWSSQPQCCLKFGTDSLAWAESDRGWRGQRRRRCVASTFTSGMVKPSPMDSNVPDIPALADRIRALIHVESGKHRAARATRSAFPRRTTVLIPDTAVRVTVLYFEELPTSREDRDNLIRWRLGQEHLFSINGAKVVSQIFPDREAQGSGVYTVLTVSIQDSVLHQYESLCESVGLIPCDVGVTSLRLLDLWRRVANGSEWRRRNVLWVTVSDRALTMIVCQGRRPIFYRCKPLGEALADNLGSPEMLNRIRGECVASLEACRQRHPSLTINQAVICAEGAASALQEHMERELRLAVEQLQWKSVETLGCLMKGSHPGVTSLAALAGVL